jgi:hypothetical protein
MPHSMRFSAPTAPSMDHSRDWTRSPAGSISRDLDTLTQCHRAHRSDVARTKRKLRSHQENAPRRATVDRARNPARTREHHIANTRIPNTRIANAHRKRASRTTARIVGGSVERSRLKRAARCRAHPKTRMPNTLTTRWRARVRSVGMPVVILACWPVARGSCREATERPSEPAHPSPDGRRMGDWARNAAAQRFLFDPGAVLGA